MRHALCARLIFEVELLSVREQNQATNGGGRAAAPHEDLISTQ